MRAALAWVLALLALSVMLGSAAAQTVPSSPVLTLDQDRLFADSLFGRRVLSMLEAEQAALVAENRKIEADLAAEEQALTIRRAGMEPGAFRALTDDFHGRVEEHRRVQDGKSRALIARRDQERQRLFEAAIPVLADLMREAGAVAILADEAIVLTFDRIDITEAAIVRLDATLGDGLPLSRGEDAPAITPDELPPADGPAPGAADPAAPPAE